MFLYKPTILSFTILLLLIIPMRVNAQVCGDFDGDGWDDLGVKYVDVSTAFVMIYRGGPQSDTGMTGKKIVVDTYGGFVSHGGGAFSGKDPTKVDRSATYMARYVAKNIVASGLAKKCTVQFAYVIGRADPVSVMVDTMDTSSIPSQVIEKAVRKVFDLRPQGIIKKLDLLRPIYKKTAVYGHFGRSDSDFTWEKTDKAAMLKSEAGV